MPYAIYRSSRIVTGPSFTSDTDIFAAKIPVAVRIPPLLSASTKCSIERLGLLRGAALTKLGRRPFSTSAQSVNWLTTSASPSMSTDYRFIFPRSS